MKRLIRAVTLVILLVVMSFPASAPVTLAAPVTQAAGPATLAAPRLVVFEGFYLPT